MSDKPYEAKRRWHWPRFSLTKFLVLVGIIAFAMSLWPSLHYRSGGFRGGNPVQSMGINVYFPNGLLPGGNQDDQVSYVSVHAYADIGSPPTMRSLELTVLSRQLVLPGVLMSAAITWKLGWAIAGRWKRRQLVAATR